MKLKEIVPILLNTRLSWRRVDDLPCTHTFYMDLYINLSLWHPNGVKTISINIDDIKENIIDVLSKDFTETDKEFEILLELYETASKHAVNIAA